VSKREFPVVFVFANGTENITRHSAVREGPHVSGTLHWS